MPLCLLVCLLWVFTDFVSATYIESTDKRLAVELEANVLIHPSSDEPRFSDSITNCFIDRVINTGFTVVLPGDECLNDLKSAHNFCNIFLCRIREGSEGERWTRGKCNICGSNDCHLPRAAAHNHGQHIHCSWKWIGWTVFRRFLRIICDIVPSLWAPTIRARVKRIDSTPT